MLHIISFENVGVLPMWLKSLKRIVSIVESSPGCFLPISHTLLPDSPWILGKDITMSHVKCGHATHGQSVKVQLLSTMISSVMGT